MEISVEKPKKLKRLPTFHYCIVRGCRNTSIKTPEKLFFPVPKGIEREKWLRILQRKFEKLKKTNLYCCEDHFSLKEDLENWVKFDLFGGNAELKAGVVPRFLLDKRTNSKVEEKQNLNSKVVYVTKFTENKDVSQIESTSKSILTSENYSELPENDIFQFGILIPTEIVEESKNQPKPIIPGENKTVRITPLTFKEVSNWISEINGFDQTEIVEEQNPADFMIQTGPFENSVSDEIDFTFPAQQESHSENIQTVKEKRKIPLILKPKIRTQIPENVPTPKKKILPKKGFSIIPKINVTKKITRKKKNPKIDAGTEMGEFLEKIKKRNIIFTSSMILKKPFLYTGLYGQDFNGILNLIMKRTGENCRDILMTLMKIRLDDSFRKLEDIFAIPEEEADDIFEKVVTNLSNVLKEFIFQPIKKITDRISYFQSQNPHKKIFTIIGYFRVKTHISGDWKHENCETIKFLISCTADGLINFVSPGFEEETKNSAVLINSNYLKYLQEKTTVIATENFFGIDQIMKDKKCPFYDFECQVKNFSGDAAKIMENYRKTLEVILEAFKEFEFIGGKNCIERELMEILNHVIIIVAAFVNNRKRKIDLIELDD